eukprot:symbB.v1.2.013400.t1/scaffold950.1/size149601/3
MGSEAEAEAGPEAESLVVPSARPKVRAKPAKSLEEIEAEKQLEAIYRQEHEHRDVETESAEKQSATEEPSASESAKEQESPASEAPRHRSSKRGEDILADFPEKRPRLEEADQDHVPCARPKQRARTQEIRFRFLGNGS